MAIEVGQYYHYCKADPVKLEIGGRYFDLMTYDICRITYAYLDTVGKPFVRYDVLTGPSKGLNLIEDLVDGKMPKYWSLTSPGIAESLLKSADKLSIGRGDYCKVKPDLLTIKGVSMRKGDVLEVEAMKPGTSLCSITYEVLSGLSKGKRFSSISAPRWSDTEFEKMAYDWETYHEATKASDDAWERERRRQESESAQAKADATPAVVTTTTTTPKAKTGAGKWLMLGAILVGGYFLIKNKTGD